MRATHRETLHSFTDDERSAFLRFVWARTRLPPGSKNLHQKFKIQVQKFPRFHPIHPYPSPLTQAAVGDGPNTTPDKFLPKAHTCFFSINLPKYSTKQVSYGSKAPLNNKSQVMATRIRYAMWNCTEMDADFKLADSELTGWVE